MSVVQGVTLHATPKTQQRVSGLAESAYDEDGELREIFRNRNRQGEYRTVIIEGGMAIKFARHSEHATHNQREWDYYWRFPENVQQLVAKPYAISDCGCVMAVELVPKTLADVFDQFCGMTDRLLKRSNVERAFNLQLKTLLTESGLFDRDEVSILMSDNHSRNIGQRPNGEWVWIDYASCYESGEEYDHWCNDSQCSRFCVS